MSALPRADIASCGEQASDVARIVPYWGYTKTPQARILPSKTYRSRYVFWLKVLKVLPLNIAFNLVNIEHVFVPLASYLFLGEMISSMRAVGIAIVLLGVWVIAEAYCRIEERV